MKINEDVSLSSSGLLLVPYCASHVPIYHAWMQDPDLQSATASEPLTLDEEYAMQRSWRTDGDKLTFIICLPRAEFSEQCSADSTPSSQAEGGQNDRRKDMVGDINLFLFERDDGDDDHDDDDEQDPNFPANHESEKTIVGELELMIARTDLQRQGLGRAALLIFIDYVLSCWDMIAQEFAATIESSGISSPNLAYFRVKINTNNHGSVCLFESLGFQQTPAGANYFGEVELRWNPTLEILRRNRHWSDWRALPYNESQS
nr:n-acetyltransferase 9-like protein [Quercus suber]